MPNITVILSQMLLNAVNASELCAMTVEYVRKMSEPAVPLLLSSIKTYQLGKNNLSQDGLR